MPQRILYISPSRVESDWRCERSRWWGHEWEDVGLRPTTSVTELIFGDIAHSALAQVASANPHPNLSGIGAQAQARARSELGPLAGATRSVELAHLAEGHLIAWATRIWPQLQRDYSVVAVEREFEFTLYECNDYRVIFRCRPDLILRRKDTGKLWYFEYKTTSSTKPQWIQSWSKAVQLHAGCRAVASVLGEPIDGCIVQGIYKGYERDDRLNSPFLYGWKKEGVPGVLRAQYSYEYMARWARFFVPSEMAMEDWVAGMPDAVVMEQFPQTAPIFQRDDLVDAFIGQRIEREREVYEAWRLMQDASTPEQQQRILDKYYPQKFNQCSPAWGSGCPFVHACWNSWIGANPLGSNYYVMRESRITTSPTRDLTINREPQVSPREQVQRVQGSEGTQEAEAQEAS